MIEINKINFAKQQGLIPVCIQNSKTLEVLMIGFMNKKALTLTCKTNKVTFWSRSKQRLWVKGESSGNYLMVVDMFQDCDDDSLLITVSPVGDTCHKGNRSCFGENNINPLIPLYDLFNTIEDRFLNPRRGSYIVSLFKEGVSRIAQKIGEEGVEVALAAVSGDKKDIKSEIADLMFHVFILMQQFNIKFYDIVDVLKNRMR